MFPDRLTIRSIRIARAKFNIGLTSLNYNLCRYGIIKREISSAGMSCPNLWKERISKEILWDAPHKGGNRLN